MKLYSYVKSLLISSILFFFFSPFVKANPILMGPTRDGLRYILLYLPLLLISTIFIEFGTILLFTKKSILNKLDLLKNVFFVNLFTFPITQLFVLFLMLSFPNLNYFYLTAEILPISLEIFLFLRIYQRFNILGFLEKSLSLNRRVFSIFSANLISFGFGIMLSFMQIQVTFD